MIRAEAAHLVEMFSSIQGEGIHVGASTLFVRFAECDLRCRWCDTPESWRRGKVARLEGQRGLGEFFVICAAGQGGVTVWFWRIHDDTIIKIVVVHVLCEGEIARIVTTGITDNAGVLLCHIGGNNPGLDRILTGGLDEGMHFQLVSHFI